MLLHDCFRRSAAAFPAKAAIIAGGRRLSFAELDRGSDILAAELQRRGIGRGDRVAAMLENSCDAVLCLWAALKAGAVFIPINHATRPDKLAFLLADSAARCLIGPEPGFFELVDGPSRRPTDPRMIDQDLALIIYTSGSTGRPKGVMLTHAAVCNNVAVVSGVLGTTPDDVVLSVLPLSFNYGLMQVLAGGWLGHTVVLERSFAYPWEVLCRAAEHRATCLPGVPTIFATLLNLAPFHGLDLSAMRLLTNTAANLPPAHIERLGEVLPRATIFSMYGLTECQRVSWLDPTLLAAKPGSVGRALPNSEVWLVDDLGGRCPSGRVGELVVRGAGLMRGYWNRPAETARTLLDGDLPGEKVLYTGDLFSMDGDGDLTFVGRRDDVFKVRGEKVSPSEIESVLYELDDVAEAAVIGMPDPVDGMAVVAHVVPRPGATLSERQLRRHCHARLEPWLVPKTFAISDALPKGDTGKIAKAALRAAI